MSVSKYYYVYFEFLGKKQKLKVMGKSPEDAKAEFYKKLIVHAVKIAENDSFNDVIDMIDQATRGIFPTDPFNPKR